MRQREREREVAPENFAYQMPTTVAMASTTQSTANKYIVNPSLSCTWNVQEPPPEPPERSYHKYMEL